MITLPPELSSIGDVFILNWAAEHIQIRVDRILEDSRSVSGEIVVSQNGGDSLSHLYHARINLLAPSAKSSLARELSSRLDDLDWATIVEQACVKTLCEYRKGEPVVNLNDLPPRSTPKYRAYPWIVDEEPTILYGYGGCAKSYLMYLIAISVHCGVPMLGIQPQQGNVLILDYETSQYTAKDRIDAIKEGMKIKSQETPLYRYCSRGLAQDITEIQKTVLAKDIKLVMVDSIGQACGGDAQSQDITRAYFRALRSLKIASLSIDHKPKSGDTSIYGSVYKFNLARLVFEAKKSQSPGGDCLDIGLYHRKANDCPLFKPEAFHIAFDGDEEYTHSTTFTKQDISGVPELSKGSPLKDQIRALLKDGRMPLTDIVETLGEKERSVLTTLYRNKRLFVQVDTINKQWGLLINDDN